MRLRDSIYLILSMFVAGTILYQQHQIDNLESVLNQQEVRLGILDFNAEMEPMPYLTFQPEEMPRLYSDNTTVTGPASKHYEQPSNQLSEEEAKELMIDPDSTAFSRATEIHISEDYGIETIYIGDFKLSLQGFPLQEGVFYIYMDGRLFEYKGVAE